MLRMETCLGIDVSGADVKIVELRRSFKKCEVLQASALRVENGDVPAAIREFLRQTGTDTSRVMCSIPTQACSVKFAELPAAKPAETSRMARYEAETQIPLPLTDLAWGYAVEKPDRGENLCHVTLAAAQQPAVDALKASFAAVGLPVSALTPAALAETRCLWGHIREHDGSVFVAHVGAEWTDLTTVSEGKVVSCRAVQHGTDGLFAAIAEDMGIDVPEAKELARERPILECRNASASPHEASVQDWIRVMAMEIRRSALTVSASADVDSPDVVILTGDGATIMGLDEALERKTELPVVVGDPWAGMTLSTVVAHCRDITPAEFAVATGLAVSGIDGGSVVSLIPMQVSPQVRRRREMATVSALGAAVVFLSAALFSGHSAIVSKTAESTHLKAQIARAQKDAVPADPGLADTAAGMSQIVNGLHRNTSDPVEILRQLSMRLPSSCWLSEFSFESGGSVVLRGSALSNSAVADAVYFVSSAGLFDSVSLDYSNLGRSQNKSVYDFRIKCALPSDAPVHGSSKRPGSAKERV